MIFEWFHICGDYMSLSEIKMSVFVFQVTGFRSYVDLYVKNKVDEMGNALNVVHEVVNERWEVCLTMSEKGFQQVSFVNSIATTKVKVTVYYTLWSVPDLWPLFKKTSDFIMLFVGISSFTCSSYFVRWVSILFILLQPCSIFRCSSGSFCSWVYVWLLSQPLCHK